MSISKFFIYGERCSGTNFLENVISTNFNLKLRNDFGSKHFFCFNHNKYNTINTDDTLFLGIVRNPIYWINSFSKELHHVTDVNKPLDKFLFSEFYSVDDDKKIILKDLNYKTFKKYNNIFELRKMKNFYLLNIMPKKVKNYILINYESLLYNYDYTMDYIKNKFGLTQKFPIYQQIKQYKKSDSYTFVKQRNILLSPNKVDIIWNNLHIDQENRLGYFKNDNNEYFKDSKNICFVSSF